MVQIASAQWGKPRCAYPFCGLIPFALTDGCPQVLHLRQLYSQSLPRMQHLHTNHRKLAQVAGAGLYQASP